MQTLPDFEVVRRAPTTVRAKPAAEAGGMPTMEVRFSRYGEWYEIDSFWEGRFLERTEHGAFSKTIAESARQIKVLFQHGFDPQIGSKVLGKIESLTEEKDSPVGIVSLFDTSYNRDLLPGLEAGEYGSSMRMRVTRDEWADEPGKSDHNPNGLPERTIKEARLFEFGPVTFPANPGSTASVRSGTDDYYSEMRSRDPERVDELMRSRNLRTSPARTAEDAANTPPAAPATGHPEGLTSSQRRARLLQTRKDG